MMYRIAYLSGSTAQSVVQALHVVPRPGDRITVDGGTSLTVREVAPHAAGSIAATVLADRTTDPTAPLP